MFFLQDQEFHLHFENDTINYDDEDPYAMENIDYLNFNVVFDNMKENNEVQEKSEENEIFIDAQKKKIEDYEKFELNNSELKTKIMRQLRKFVPSKIKKK